MPADVTGAFIRETRKSRGWSQEMLAEQALTSRQTISALEKGSDVGVEILERVAVALEIRELPLGSVTLRTSLDVGRALDVWRIERAILDAQDAVDKAADTWRSEMSKLVIQENRDEGSVQFRTLRQVVPHPDLFSYDFPADAPIEQIGEVQDEVEVEIEAWVAAGEPLLDYSHKGESESVPASHAPERNWKVLKARGDSMVEYGIEDGDLLYVEPRRAGVAANGELVIGWLNDGIVVKRWYRQRGKKMLISGNPNIPPRVLTPEDTWELQAIVRKSIGKTIRTRTFHKLTAASRPSPSRKGGIAS